MLCGVPAAKELLIQFIAADDMMSAKSGHFMSFIPAYGTNDAV